MHVGTRPQLKRNFERNGAVADQLAMRALPAADAIRDALENFARMSDYDKRYNAQRLRHLADLLDGRDTAPTEGATA